MILKGIFKFTFFKFYFLSKKIFFFGREKKAQLGRSWTHPTIPEGECLIFNDVANYLGVNVGEYIVISFFWNETFPWHYQTTLKEFPNATDSGYINLMLKINQIISSSERKWNERAIYG